MSGAERLVSLGAAMPKETEETQIAVIQTKLKFHDKMLWVILGATIANLVTRMLDPAWIHWWVFAFP
jgi:hypothetical protein